MSVHADNYWLSAAERAAAVTPNDSNNLALSTQNPSSRSLWVGGTGAIKVTLDGQKDSQAVTLSAIPAGTLLPIQAKKVWSTGTTATLIVALY